ncbi:MAG: hypothetical protein ABWY20_23830 [Mycobacterium sp.]
MTDDTVTLAELRAQLRALTQAIRDAEQSYEAAHETAADAEAIYRSELAKALARHRSNSAGVTEAETLARGDVVLHSRERDAAAGKVRYWAELLENRRDDRRQLWRLVDVIRPRQAADGRSGEGWP